MKRFVICAAAAAVSMMVAGARAGTITFDSALAAPGFYNGTGPVQNGFTVDTESNGIELGLRAMNRFLGAIDSPTNTYTVVGGLDPTQLPSIRATWNYDYSINLANSGFTLATVVAQLTITDTSPGGSSAFYNALDPALGDATNGNIGAQNSENLGFNFALGSAYFAAHASDSFNFRLDLFDKQINGNPGALLASDNINVVAVGTPLPATALQGAALLSGLGLFAASKRRKSVPAL